MKRLKSKYQYQSAKRRLESLILGKKRAAQEKTGDREMQAAVIAGMQSMIDELMALVTEYEHAKESHEEAEAETEEKGANREA